MTNFEKIKNMSVEELAMWLVYCTSFSVCNYCSSDCFDCEEEKYQKKVVEWLESEGTE